MTFVDPEDPNTVYFSMQHAAVRRKDMKADNSKSIQPSLPEDHLGQFNSNFITPYLLSDHDHQTLYLAGNYVFKSENQGEEWIVISPDLSKSKDSLKQSMAAGTLSESPIQPGLLYVGTDKGAFWVSENDGETWIERSSGLPNAYVRSIAPSQHKLGRLYLAATGLNYDDFSTYLFVSENHGKNWNPINGNLPGEIANVILEDLQNEKIIYVGSSRGVYISINRGTTWSLLGKDMPMVAVADLEIEPRSNDLIAATHGRGFYKVNLSPIYEAMGQGDGLYSIPTAFLPKRIDTHNDFSRKTYAKTPITFTSDGLEKVSIEIRDESDSLWWKTDMEANPGINQFRWDLITERVTSDSPYFVHYDKFIKPGEYKVLLKTSDMTREEKLVVKKYMDR